MLPVLLAAATTAAPAAKAAAPAVKATTVPLQLPSNFFDTTPHSWLASHAGWLTHTLAGLFVLLGFLLVLFLALQTTKQEGLSGTLGGQEIKGLPADAVRDGMRVRAKWKPPAERTTEGQSARGWGSVSGAIDGFEGTGEPDVPKSAFRDHII